ncbi:MAG: hypothetical protein IPM29_06285 [Planctomycetes bacterium]|nr:hypothetical protein [Planctomycetota bacterium]
MHEAGGGTIPDHVLGPDWEPWWEIVRQTTEAGLPAPLQAIFERSSSGSTVLLRDGMLVGFEPERPSVAERNTPRNRAAVLRALAGRH